MEILSKGTGPALLTSSAKLRAEEIGEWEEKVLAEELFKAGAEADSQDKANDKLGVPLQEPALSQSSPPPADTSSPSLGTKGSEALQNYERGDDAQLLFFIATGMALGGLICLGLLAATIVKISRRAAERKRIKAEYDATIEYARALVTAIEEDVAPLILMKKAKEAQRAADESALKAKENIREWSRGPTE